MVAVTELLLATLRPGRHVVQLDPQGPRGGLESAQGRLMSELQLASKYSCLAFLGPMTVQHAPYLCAGIPRMRTQARACCYAEKLN